MMISVPWKIKAALDVLTHDRISSFSNKNREKKKDLGEIPRTSRCESVSCVRRRRLVRIIPLRDFFYIFYIRYTSFSFFLVVDWELEMNTHQKKYMSLKGQNHTISRPVEPIGLAHHYSSFLPHYLLFVWSYSSVGLWPGRKKRIGRWHSHSRVSVSFLTIGERETFSHDKSIGHSSAHGVNYYVVNRNQ